VSKPPTRTLLIAVRARRDIAEVLLYSLKEFGEAAALRYDALLKQALRDLKADPLRPGVSHRHGLPSDIYLYHLGFSRGRVAEPPVNTPRHFVAFRLTVSRIEVLRILHDSRDVARHLPA
jgi:toxin ParE1/3/4